MRRLGAARNGRPGWLAHFGSRHRAYNRNSLVVESQLSVAEGKFPLNIAQTTTPSTLAIQLDRVTKVYSRTEARASTLKEQVIGSLSRWADRDRLVALDRLDLTVGRGEALGIIGPNGSGKSTLLKLIAGVTRPTSGQVQTRGRVLGLIELGAGFHPELTGEENIRLQAAIYGLSERQVQPLIEPILAFAELTDFRAMPVKHYSSGMFVRLGFSIAIHVEPDILLVDEVLAVGDESFQERCLRAIARLRRRGVTLLLVTHYPEQVERVCDRVLWLENGQARRIGLTAEVVPAYRQDLIRRYHGEGMGRSDDQVWTVGQPGRFGTGEARVDSIRILASDGSPRTHFGTGEPIAIEIDYTAAPHIEAVDCTIPLDTVDGRRIDYWKASRDAVPGRPREGKGRFRLEITHPRLLPGRYRMSIALSPPEDPWKHSDLLYKLFHFSIQPLEDWETVAPFELRPDVEVEE